MITDLVENSSDKSQNHNPSYNTSDCLLKWELFLIQLHLGINLHTQLQEQVTLTSKLKICIKGSIIV